MIRFAFLIFVVLAHTAFGQGVDVTKDSRDEFQLKLRHLDEPAVELGRPEFEKLPHISVTVIDRDGASESYSGVPLHKLLEQTTAPQGETLRAGALRCYVLVKAKDGYEVLFSLPELDPDFSDRQIILADKKNGEALDLRHGPLQLIVPHEKRKARWVRSVVSISVLESTRGTKLPTKDSATNPRGSE